MEKNSKTKKRGEKLSQGDRKWLRLEAAKQYFTVGVDTGDSHSAYSVLGKEEDFLYEGSLPTTSAGVCAVFENMPRVRVVLEAGTHSPWISRLLTSLGHEVIVANPHKVKLITQSVRKNDRMDARKLARLGRADANLLYPIRHRGPEVQADLAVIRARTQLVKMRTATINSARGLAKPMGERLKKCDADQVTEAMAEGCSESLQEVILPLLKVVTSISEQIAEYDKKIGEIAKRYPEMALLTQVYGVGTLIALTYILTIEDAERFAHSRDVGPYLGLHPKQRDSGANQPQMGISKTGDVLLRSLLVQGAHCILRKGSPDSDLQAWGLSKQGGGKRAKKRAVVGVARKLAVLLHRLWVTGEVYDPLYNRKAVEAEQAKAKARRQAAVA